MCQNCKLMIILTEMKQVKDDCMLTTSLVFVLFHDTCFIVLLQNYG